MSRDRVVHPCMSLVSLRSRRKGQRFFTLLRYCPAASRVSSTLTVTVPILETIRHSPDPRMLVTRVGYQLIHLYFLTDKM